MKTNYFKIALTLLLFTAGMAISKAQNVKTKDVPAPVRSAFSDQYPAATDISWKMAGTNYHVSFDVMNVDYKATYSPDGKVVSYQKEITNGDLPRLIADQVKTSYPGKGIDSVEWVNTLGTVSYKIELKGKPEKTVWYGADGKLIKEEND